jgi:hypothetical protein
MSGMAKQPENTIARQVLETLRRYPELIRHIPVGTALHRVQPSL